MNKNEILELLNKYDFDYSKVIILSGASLVLQGVIEKTNDIDLATSLEYYKSLNLNTTIGAFGKEIKYIDNIEISFNLNDSDYIMFDNYKVQSLSSIYEIKKLLNRDKDKEVIKKLKKILNIN